MNIKQRIRLNDLDPRDPDHDSMEELQERWKREYMEEYAEHGTIAGADAWDLEVDPTLERLRELALEHMVASGGMTSQIEEEWALYGARLYELMYEAASEAVQANWEDIKKDELEQCYDL